MLEFSRRRFSRGALGLGMMGMSVLPSWAKDEYPDHTVKVLIGFTPGGSVDVVARLIAEKMSAQLGQPFIVENRPGAAGNLAAAVAAEARPDGYTLYVCTSANAMYPYLYKELSYDPKKDFSLISRWITTSYILVVRPELQLRSLKDLVDYARRNPGKLSYGTQGVGTPPHLAGEMLSERAEINMLPIPFKGGPETIVGVMSGVVDLTFSPVPVALPLIKGGRLRSLAVTGSERSPLVPDVPTVAEQGFPGYQITYWYGLAAPAGTPEAVITLLSKQTNVVLALSDVREKLIAQGMEPSALSGSAFRSFFDIEMKRYSEMISEAKIKPI